MRSNRLAAGQLPRAGAVTERLAGQRAYGANVDHVARQLRVHRLAHKGFDFSVFAAVRHAQFHHAGHFLPKAHAACAMNASAHLLHADQRPYILDSDNSFFFFIARGRSPVADSQVLQLAFAALVADGAVQWVIDEQKFHHRLLRLYRPIGFGAHDHALGHGRGASGHGLGCFFNIYQTHTAVGRNAQFFVITKVRNVGAGFFSRVHDHAALNNFDLLTVQFNFNHERHPSNVGTDHTGLVLHVVFKFVTEMLEHAAHRQSRCVTQSANGAAHDAARHTVKHVQITGTAMAVFNSVDHAPQPTRAFTARRALAAGLMRVEV